MRRRLPNQPELGGGENWRTRLVAKVASGLAAVLRVDMQAPATETVQRQPVRPVQLDPETPRKPSPIRTPGPELADPRHTVISLIQQRFGWEQARQRQFLIDPRALENDNYAHYPADDELRAITSDAERDAWIAQKRAVTPPKPFHVRLFEIAGSSRDYERMRDPATSEVADYSGSEEGLSVQWFGYRCRDYYQLDDEGELTFAGRREFPEPRQTKIQPRPKKTRILRPGDDEYYFDPTMA